MNVELGGSKVIQKKADGSVQIGADGNIHIGKNSLITPEEHSTLSDGTKVHHLWAEDATDTKIPINIFGSKLLIDGVELKAGDSEQVTTNTSNITTNTSNITTNTNNINNLGSGIAGSTALTAALAALPQVSKDTEFSCGVGSGAYSSRIAIGFGCASKVNDRVDLNAGGSFVFGGAKSYGGGTLDNTVVKAGIVFKLGKSTKPTLISMNDKKALQSRVESLDANNKIITDKNEAITQSNQELRTLVAKQNERIEKLEKIALANQSNPKTATCFMNISNLFSTMKSLLISSN